MNLQIAINENLENKIYQAKRDFKCKVDTALAEIINLQDSIAELAEKLIEAKRNLKTLEYVEPKIVIDLGD